MNAISVLHGALQRAAAAIVTMLLFGVAAYLASAFVVMLPHAFRHVRDMSPDAGGFHFAADVLVLAGRSALATYPGILLTPAFFAAGLGAAAIGLWRGKPPLESALLPWAAVSSAIAGVDLYRGETTVMGLARAWPFYSSDAVIACVCWALARRFW